MKIDAQTLKELEIFSGGVGAPGLFERLDRTRTKGGRESLRRRFLRPLVGTAAILKVQESVRWLSDHASTLESIPSESHVQPILRYFESADETLQKSGLRGHVEATWLRLRYADHYTAALGGIRTTHSLLTAIRDLSKRLDDGPALIQDLLVELRTALSDEIAQRALDRGTIELRGRAALMLDRDIRAKTGMAVLSRIIDVVHEVDALASLARCTIENGFTWPTPQDGVDLEVRGLHHPLVTHPVLNDLEPAAATRIIFVTGPNTAGKTTYLKSCATVVYLAHLGMGVPARRMTWSPYRSMVSCIGTTETMHNALSFFQAEARRMRDVAVTVGTAAPAFVIIDEMFKGTNVKDALEASHRVISAFSKVSAGSLFLISSHLTELVSEGVGSMSGLECHHFSASGSGHEDLRFTYVKQPGWSEQRLGMLVLEREGVLSALDKIRSARLDS